MNISKEPAAESFRANLYSASPVSFASSRQTPPLRLPTPFAFEEAQQNAPSVIFIDEIHSIAPQRGGLGEPAATERVVNTMLAEMEGLEEMQGVVVVGATNRPTLLDPALLRPGRFDEFVEVPVPETEGCRTILGIYTAEMLLGGDVDLGTLAERTAGYTGANLEKLVRRAGLLTLREALKDARWKRARRPSRWSGPRS